ncbi:hypothetical protein LZC95_45300 [Pendulispora brunnea]|uniref:Uncharacterized protein n=1 Tax=Pendulispora brunnea TaxID=2905690 RepID=A0ABZ2K4M6_9BACT
MRATTDALLASTALLLIRPPWSWSLPQWLPIGSAFPSEDGKQDDAGRLPGEQVNAALAFSKHRPAPRPPGPRSSSIRTWSGGEWRKLGNSLNAPDEEVRGITLATDATNNPFVTTIQVNNLYLSRSQFLSRRFGGSAWTNYGPELGKQGFPFLFAPMRGGHLFAYVALDDALRALDITSAGCFFRLRPRLRTIS